MTKPSEAPGRGWAPIAFVISVAAFVWAGAWLDVFIGGAARMNWFALIPYVVLATPALCVVSVARRRWMLWTLPAAVAVVAALSLTQWHPRKRFLADLDSIHAGMAIGEVRSRMARYQLRIDRAWEGPGPYPYGSDPDPRTDWSLAYAWTSTDGGYDADVGEIQLCRGRVVHVEFSPD